MKKFSLRQLIIAALIAAVYAVLTVPLGALASQSFLQVRPAEALTILPLLFIEAVPGVAVGCLIANIFSGNIYDIVFGTLITLAAAIITRKLKNPYLGALPPVLLNAALLPLIWRFTGSDTMYFYSFLSTLATQALWIYGLGIPLYRTMQKLKPKIYGEIRK